MSFLGKLKEKLKAKRITKERNFNKRNSEKIKSFQFFSEFVGKGYQIKQKAT